MPRQAQQEGGRFGTNYLRAWPVPSTGHRRGITLTSLRCAGAGKVRLRMGPTWQEPRKKADHQSSRGSLETRHVPMFHPRNGQLDNVAKFTYHIIIIKGSWGAASDVTIRRSPDPLRQMLFMKLVNGPRLGRSKPTDLPSGKLT